MPIPKWPEARSRGRRELSPCLALLLLGAILRLAGLGQEALWTDEYLTLHVAGFATLHDVLAEVKANNPHPPLYFLLIHYWLRWFGDADFSLRLPSAIAGLLSPALMYAMLRALLPAGRTTAFLAGCLLACSPMHLHYSQEARPYALLLFFELASLASLAWLPRSPRSRRWPLFMAMAICLALALATHFFALFVWLTIFTSISLWMRRALLPKADGYLYLGVLLLLMLPPAGASLARLYSGSGVSWLPLYEDASLFYHAFRAQILGVFWSPLPPTIEAGLLLLALVCIGRGIVLASRDDLRCMLPLGFFFLFVLPLLISYIKPIVFYGQRYMIVALPVVLGLLALNLNGAWYGLWRRLWALAVLVLVVAQALWLWHYYAHRQKALWDVAGHWILDREPGRGLVYTMPVYNTGLPQRYLGDRFTVLGVEDFSQADLAARKLESAPLYIICVADPRPWLDAHAIAYEKPLGLFETERPPTQIWVVKLKTV